MTKLLSVITINLNNKIGLRETIKSVLEQSFKEFEYIVIDGGSKDGSIEEIRRNEESIDYWHSKPDGGIYSAMNQGLEVASGEFVQFLNSGDILNNQSVLNEFHKSGKDTDIIYGYIVDKNNIELKIGARRKISKFYLCDLTIKHPGAFVKKSLFRKAGNFDESFRISGDYDFFLRALFKEKASISFINLCVARFDTTGISNSIVALRKSEGQRAREKNIDPFPNFICHLRRLLKKFRDILLLNHA